MELPFDARPKGTRDGGLGTSLNAGHEAAQFVQLGLATRTMLEVGFHLTSLDGRQLVVDVASELSFYLFTAHGGSLPIAAPVAPVIGQTS